MEGDENNYHLETPKKPKDNRPITVVDRAEMYRRVVNGYVFNDTKAEYEYSGKGRRAH